MVPILIVDDSQDDLFLAKRVVRKAKILNPIHLFSKAADCIEFFGTAPPDAQPALIFLDLVMKPLSGLDVFPLLAHNPLFKQSITVMLTNLSDIPYIHESYQAGASSFLMKPFELNDLTVLISSFSKHFVLQERPGGNYLLWVKNRQPHSTEQNVPANLTGNSDR